MPSLISTASTPFQATNIISHFLTGPARTIVYLKMSKRPPPATATESGSVKRARNEVLNDRASEDGGGGLSSEESDMVILLMRFEQRTQS